MGFSKFKLILEKDLPSGFVTATTPYSDLINALADLGVERQLKPGGLDGCEGRCRASDPAGSNLFLRSKR